MLQNLKRQLFQHHWILTLPLGGINQLTIKVKCQERTVD